MTYQEAFEKQVPKEPINKIICGVAVSFYCPICRNILKSRQKFCDECGQVIGWNKINWDNIYKKSKKQLKWHGMQS